MFKSTKFSGLFVLTIAVVVTSATTIAAQDYYTGVSNAKPTASANIQPLNAAPATNNNPANGTKLVPVNEPRVAVRTELNPTDADLSFDIGAFESEDATGMNSSSSTVVPPATNNLNDNSHHAKARTGSAQNQIVSNETVVDPLRQSLGSPGSPQSAAGSRAPASWQKNSLTAAIASIAIVVALFFVFKLFSRKVQKGNNQHLPSEVIQVVGWSKLNSRQNLQLVRFGTKLVLLAVSQNSAEPIAEVTDPIEVEEILAACQNNGGLSRAIRRLASGRNQSPQTATGYPPAGTVFEA